MTRLDRTSPPRWRWLLVLGFLLPMPFAKASAAGAPADDSVEKIVADYQSVIDSEDPDRSPGWTDNSPAAIAARAARLADIETRLKRLPDTSGDDETALTQAILAWRLDMRRQAARFDEERMPFIAGDGFFTTPTYTASTTVIRNGDDARAWLTKISLLPAYYDQAVANMRRGIATGFVQPRVVVQAAAEMVRRMHDQPIDDDPLLKPFATRPSAVSEENWQQFRAQARHLLQTQVRPAQAKLRDFFEKDYLPHARATIGISSVPGGRDYYAHLVRRNTSTTMTPDAVFALGEAEVRRIRAEMDAAIRATGFQGDFNAFLDHVRADRAFYAADRDDYFEKASEIAKRIDFLLPRYFGTLPRLTYGVRSKPPELEGSSGAYYLGDPAKGVAGSVVIGRGAEDKPLFSLPAWMLHEGVPGHHLQIALGQERQDIPPFRRKDDITAFVEGWALYAEKLGTEMGVYRNAYEQFGRLSFEMWRACRLVMDVGIHWRGWSAEQASACLRENSALPASTIEAETLRYIGWPGQAIAYKVGEVEIIRLRRRAESRLGSRFDLRAFHDMVVGSGPLPLSVLADRTDRWIEAQLQGQ